MLNMTHDRSFNRRYGCKTSEILLLSQTQSVLEKTRILMVMSSSSGEGIFFKHAQIKIKRMINDFKAHFPK